MRDLDFDKLMDQEKFKAFQDEVRDVWDWLEEQPYSYASDYIDQLEMIPIGFWRDKKEGVKDFNGTIAYAYGAICWTGYRGYDEYQEWFRKFLGVDDE